MTGTMTAAISLTNRVTAVSVLDTKSYSEVFVLWIIEGVGLVLQTHSSVYLAHCESGSLMFRLVVCEVICTVGFIKEWAFLLKQSKDH